MFDRLERGNFFAVHKSEGVADILGAAGPADAMDVIFRMFRHVVIDDVTDTGDVEAARRNIGRDHDFVFARLKSFQCFDPFTLGAVGMQNRDSMVGLLQFMRDAIGVHFCSAKNQNAVELRSLKQRHEQIEFLFGRDRINRVGDGLGRRTAHANFDQFRIPQDPFGQSLDFRRQGGRKEKRLSIRGNFFDDLADLRQKPHVEHAIDLIENENAYVSEMKRLLFEVVE